MDEVAPFILLMPVVGIVTAYFLLGEQISVAQLAGGAVLLAGLAVVSGIGIPEKLKAGLVARP
jgi:O-acetylserine/cysteine efflux transporter